MIICGKAGGEHSLKADKNQTKDNDMTRIMIAVAALVLTGAANAETSDIDRICTGDVIVSAANVSANPDGYYVPEMLRQISLGDPRIHYTSADHFTICRRPDWTPDMASRAFAISAEHMTITHIFVPIQPRSETPSS